MKHKLVAVCYRCEEHIPLTSDEEIDDRCPFCDGNIADRKGQVMVLSIWEKENPA